MVNLGDAESVQTVVPVIHVKAWLQVRWFSEAHHLSAHSSFVPFIPQFLHQNTWVGDWN